MDRHLPEPRREVDGGENGRVGSSDVSNALTDFLHGVLVDLRVLVESPKVLYNAEALTVLLGHTENRGVVERAGSPYHAQFEPFLQGLLDEGLVSRFERELLLIDWFVVLEMQSVGKRSTSSQIGFVDADHLSILFE